MENNNIYTDGSATDPALNVPPAKSNPLMLISGLVLIAIIGSGLYFLIYNGKNSPVVATSSDMSNWKTYENLEINLRIKLPQSWNSGNMYPNNSGPDNFYIEFGTYPQAPELALSSKPIKSLETIDGEVVDPGHVDAEQFAFDYELDGQSKITMEIDGYKIYATCTSYVYELREKNLEECNRVISSLEFKK